MKFVLFYHSLVSDWNHGNAHFLRGIISELLSRGHDVRVMEPSDGWSREQLRLQHGQAALDAYREKYPQLSSQTYALHTAEIERAVEGADVVIAHEWNAPALIATLGRLRRESMAFHLLFHDTHHRCLSGIGVTGNAPRRCKNFYFRRLRNSI